MNGNGTADDNSKDSTEREAGGEREEREGGLYMVSYSFLHALSTNASSLALGSCLARVSNPPIYFSYPLDGLVCKGCFLFFLCARPSVAVNVCNWIPTLSIAPPHR